VDRNMKIEQVAAQLFTIRNALKTPADIAASMKKIAGNLDWRAIVREADAAGCEWYMVEQDMCPGDPFASLKQSFDYIREHLCT
jgi:sugar phosphate isomerase/epimerase